MPYKEYRKDGSSKIKCSDVEHTLLKSIIRKLASAPRQSCEPEGRLGLSASIEKGPERDRV